MSKQSAKDNPPGSFLNKGRPYDFQFVHFKVSGAGFCIAVDEVKEIIPYSPPARKPRAMEGMAGFVELRGISVPLIDIRKRFSLPSSGQRPAKILIVRFEGRIAGIIADEVIDVEHKTIGAEGGARILTITTSEILTPEEKRFFDSPYTG
ncbi:MAG: chemotaxis protein CheW [Deltaproteobacteria bacterium]|nr:chemotaxis protein CheW [Deltaproteobacteria bacterium]